MVVKNIYPVLSKYRRFIIGHMIVGIIVWMILGRKLSSLKPLRKKLYGSRYVVRDYWTSVKGLNDTHVYNAYFTGRDDHVRIVGVGPTDLQTCVQCTFLCETKQTMVSGKIVQMLDSHGLRHNNIEILCKVPTDCHSNVVSVSGPGANSDIYLKIYFPPTRPVKTSPFTVCFPAIHSNFGRFTEIVQSLEMDTLLGAQSFNVHYNSATPEVETVLRMYVDSGRLKMFQWNLPKVDVHYFAQVSSIRDCFYRNMHSSKYIVFKDFDEVLLPYNHNDWKSLLEDLLKKDPKLTAFIFKNSFIYKGDPDVSEGMTATLYDAARASVLSALLKQHRHIIVWPGKMRSKFIVNPEGVDNVEIHMVKALREGYTSVVINETDALLFHYKRFVDRTIPRKRDSSVLRFKGQLVDRVDKVYLTLNTHYTIWKPLFT